MDSETFWNRLLGCTTATLHLVLLERMAHQTPKSIYGEVLHAFIKQLNTHTHVHAREHAHTRTLTLTQTHTQLYIYIYVYIL